MKINDYSGGLDKLRQKMGADLKKWVPNSNWIGFDPFGFRATLRDKGEVDIPFSEININSDETLSLYGQKILVYIRDQIFSGKLEYRFHIANCQTLKGAIQNKRYERYVASINTDGKFKVNLIHGNSWIEKDKDVELKVCMNCLTSLNYKNYRSLNWSLKTEIHKNFKIDEYFSLFNNQEIKKPKHTNVTAPFNNYTEDHKRIRNDLMLLRSFTCDECKKLLQQESKFLHLHHINGEKHNNRHENLKLLCIECHSNQPSHGHMKSLPEYREFMLKYGNKLF